MTRCHAGAGHADATDRGPAGELCLACWLALSWLVASPARAAELARNVADAYRPGGVPRSPWT